MPRKTFEQWKLEVDAVLRGLLGGLTSEDLPDAPYRRWYDDNVPPAKAARRALKMAETF